MQACVDWVLIIFGTQVIKKKRPARPVFPDCFSVSYDYGSSDIDIFKQLAKGKEPLERLHSLGNNKKIVKYSVSS